jgi:flagellar motor protein MotB
METKVKSNSAAINNNKADNKQAFVNNNPVNKDNIELGKPQPQAEKLKELTTGEKTDQFKQQAEQTKSDEPKAEQVKEEPKAEPKPEAKPAKPALNLEETLKLVAELNRRKIQRDKLIETIENLEAFEISIKEDADETYGNIYQGCVLTIEDDNKRKFSTKNPVIIWTVAQQVNSMCVNKLSEIEAGIIIPQ